VDEQPIGDEKHMRLRFDGVCRLCGVALPAKSEAVYERSSKTVRCVTHADPTGLESGMDTSLDPGTPGKSARKEFERRKARRERRIRAEHPKLGGLIHALTDEPQSTSAWDTGALGEERLGKRLNELGSDRLRVLHDRRIPGSRANIDHLAVTPTGIYVIDAKKYTGRPNLHVERGLFRPRTDKLLVGTRDCSKLVDGVLKQVGVVEGAINAGVPVHGVLCFVEADWPLIGGSFTTRGVEVLWPKKLYPNLNAAGPISTESINEICKLLATTLPAA
jgi:nuclease-like protein